MSVKVEVETVDDIRRRLTVEVPAEEVDRELKQAYAALRRTANVSGFRPGRVPQQVIEQRFGARVRAEVFEDLIRKSYSEAVTREAIDVVGDPEIVTEQAEGGAPLRYTATVEVKPDVVADHYRGLDVQRPVVTVTDQDVDTYLKRLRESLAQLHPVADRTAVDWGDVVTLDYEAREDAKLLGRGEQRPIEMGNNGFPPEFDRAVVGAEVGSTREFSTTYGDDAPNKDLAGKTVHFQVRVHALSTKELPTLDDDFAKDHGECSTLEELREKTRARLQAEAERYADETMRGRLLAELARAHEVAVPEAMVERRMHALVDEALRELSGGVQRRTEQPELVARLRHELEPRAREQVKVALLLEAVARQEGIEVSDADVESQIDELAEQAGTAAARVRSLYQDADVRRRLRDRIAQTRAVDAVARHAKITDVQPESGVAAVPENG